MRMNMKRFLVAGVVALVGGAPVYAAQVTNKDDKTVVIVVVDDGSRMNVAIAPGATESICPSGCFMTAPDGDRIGLDGGETVEIKGGSATVK